MEFTDWLWIKAIAVVVLFLIVGYIKARYGP